MGVKFRLWRFPVWLRMAFVTVAILSIPLAWIAYQLHWIKERQSLLTDSSVLLMDSSGRLLLNPRGVTHLPFGFSLLGDPGWEVIRCSPGQYDRFKALFPEAIVVTSPEVTGDAPERWPDVGSDNFLEVTKRPAIQRTDVGIAVAEQLAASHVPTMHEAETFAEQAWVDCYGGLDAALGVRGAALYRVAADLPGFSKAQDLIWEIHMWRGDSASVAGVVWVSTSTKAAKIRFPFDRR